MNIECIITEVIYLFLEIGTCLGPRIGDFKQTTMKRFTMQEVYEIVIVLNNGSVVWGDN